MLNLQREGDRALNVSDVLHQANIIVAAGGTALVFTKKVFSTEGDRERSGLPRFIPSSVTILGRKISHRV